MIRSVKLWTLGAALLVSLAGIPAMAVPDAAAIVKQRQDAMRLQYRQLLVIKNFMEGKGEQSAAVAAADDLTRTVPKIPDLFPPGTGMAPPKGRFQPKPEVWTQWDKFLAASKTVVGKVTVLDAAVKSGDKQRIKTAFTDLNGCNACHDDFREKVPQ